MSEEKIKKQRGRPPKEKITIKNENNYDVEKTKKTETIKPRVEIRGRKIELNINENENQTIRKIRLPPIYVRL